MSRSQIYRRALPLVFGLTCSVVSVGACADERDAFDPQDRTFDLDASSADAPSCLVECSLDGRSIIDTCTGAVVETCRRVWWREMPRAVRRRSCGSKLERLRVLFPDAAHDQEVSALM